MTLRRTYGALAGIHLTLAYEWGKGGFSKWWGGTFVDGLEKTLTSFASKNPHTWYVDAVLLVAKAHAETFGWLVIIAEMAIATGLVLALLFAMFGKEGWMRSVAMGAAIVSLLVGMFLNVQFYFAAGWMSPSTHGLNVVLFWVQLAMIVAWIGWWREPECATMKS